MNLANKSLLITLISLCTLNVYSTRLCLFVTELLVVRCDKIYPYQPKGVVTMLVYYVRCDKIYPYQSKGVVPC